MDAEDRGLGLALTASSQSVAYQKKDQRTQILVLPPFGGEKMEGRKLEEKKENHCCPQKGQKAIAIADLFGLGVKTKLPGVCLSFLGKVGAFFPQNEPTHET